MFSKATANFVRQIDPEGSLIHVSRLNNSHKLAPMKVVIKRKRLWFWQKPKYDPTDFTLGDLLQGDKMLTAKVNEKDFLSYEGTFGGKISGNLDTEAGPVKATLKGHGATKLQSCFGKLKKEELDVKKLLEDSRERKVDMKHWLVQQLEKRADVLAVVKERIFATDPCYITHTRKDQCTFQGVLGLLNMLGSSFKQVSMRESNGMEADSDVSVVIPSGTVIAYSVLELAIKKDGSYNVCLQPEKAGGIEEDSPVTGPSQDPMDIVDGTWGWVTAPETLASGGSQNDVCPQPEETGGIEVDSSVTGASQVPMDTMDGKCSRPTAPETLASGASQNGSQEMDLSPLAELPQSARFTMFEKLQETLRDTLALSYLQCVLEELCGGESFDMENDDGLSESQKKTLSAILDNYTNKRECEVPAHLNAAHLLVSAMEELPEETQRLLGESCPKFLEAMYTLLCRLKDSSEPLSIQSLPAILQENQTFQQAEKLLSSTQPSAPLTLRRGRDSLWMEKGPQAGALLVALCLSIQGLSFLSKGLEQ